MRSCSIIIPAYNNANDTDKCLSSISKLNFDRSRYEVLVIDNNSTDNTAEVISTFSQVVYLKEATQGASFARNKGIQSSKGDILVFLDSDATVTPNWLSSLLEPFSEADVGAVGGAIYPANERSLISRYLGISLFMRYHRYGNKREIKGYPSCNLAILKSLIPEGFDTSRFTTYGEDKDICYRVLEKGMKVLFEPTAVIKHRHPETLRGLVSLLAKSSEGRASFAKKYPTAPDIVFFNTHIPLLYVLLIILSALLFGLRGLLISLSPALIYLLCGSILSFIRSRDILISFFVKPILDVLSVFVIYIAYQRNRLKKTNT